MVADNSRNGTTTGPGLDDACYRNKPTTLLDRCDAEIVLRVRFDGFERVLRGFHWPDGFCRFPAQRISRHRRKAAAILLLLDTEQYFDAKSARRGIIRLS